MEFDFMNQSLPNEAGNSCSRALVHGKFQKPKKTAEGGRLCPLRAGFLVVETFREPERKTR